MTRTETEEPRAVLASRRSAGIHAAWRGIDYRTADLRQSA
jgi:hypothetical protein